VNALLFSPHNDDETLFAFYQCMRYEPKVYIVLRSYKQWMWENGPNHLVREAETEAAMLVAGCEWSQLLYPDDDPPWRDIAEFLLALLLQESPKTLIYPAWEMGGHEDHNAVASILGGIDGPWEHVRYLTYQRGYGRSVKGAPVEVEKGWSEKKKLALGCYHSQYRLPQCAPWFPGGEYADLKEWIV